MESQLTPANTLVMSRTLMPAKGRFDASPLAASVASRRTWLFLIQWTRGFRSDVRRAHIELLSKKFVILKQKIRKQSMLSDGTLPYGIPEHELALTPRFIASFNPTIAASFSITIPPCLLVSSKQSAVSKDTLLLLRGSADYG
jgi:hypothetical protein